MNRLEVATIVFAISAVWFLVGYFVCLWRYERAMEALRQEAAALRMQLFTGATNDR